MLTAFICIWDMCADTALSKRLFAHQVRLLPRSAPPMDPSARAPAEILILIPKAWNAWSARAVITTRAF